jgi:hypothetical protein
MTGRKRREKTDSRCLFRGRHVLLRKWQPSTTPSLPVQQPHPRHVHKHVRSVKPWVVNIHRFVLLDETVSYLTLFCDGSKAPSLRFVGHLRRQRVQAFFRSPDGVRHDDPFTCFATYTTPLPKRIFTFIFSSFTVTISAPFLVFRWFDAISLPVLHFHTVRTVPPEA